MTFITAENLVQEKSDFMGYPATVRLKKLAREAIDLSKPGSLTPERLSNFYSEACGYKLLYGTERVTSEVIDTLHELARESKALEKMKRMQEGEVMNLVKPYPSENRSVLHTATRDFFDHPRKGIKAQEAAAFSRQELERLRVFMAKLDVENKFDDMIVIGIGGSELGPRANYDALKHLTKERRQVYFVSNIDPDDAASVLKQVNLPRTLVAAISKSGTTLETDTNEAIVRAAFKKAGLDPKSHFISVTMPGTPMDNPFNYVENFHLGDWVGGRYSTTSMVGGVILAFAFGFDVFWELLKGAHAMDLTALSSDLKTNLPLLAALIGIWNHNFLQYPTVAIIPYSQALRSYPAHLQQVDMESNGKLIDQKGKFADFETGPVLWGAAGTNAQHSFFQLLHQGTATIPLLMIGYCKSQFGQDLEVQGTTSQEKLLSNLFAQSLALALGNQPDNPNKFCPGNRPSMILLGERLTPFSLGALLSFYENQVAFQGFIWGINSFDQEGVQLGKVLAKQLIGHFAAVRTKSKTQPSDPLGDAYLKHIF